MALFTGQIIHMSLDLNKKRLVESPLWNSPTDCLLKEVIERTILSVDPGAGLGNQRLP